MKRIAQFPSFTWDGFFWVTSAKLPAWSGYQIRDGAYGSVSSKRPSDGTVRIVFAPEGREEAPLSKSEIDLVRWLVENQSAVHDAMLERLFEQYPSIREETLEWLTEKEAKKLLPPVKSPEQLKKLTGISAINVHQISADGKPFIGVELGCTWDEEGGVGILLHGSTPLEVGGADTAILLWVAEKYAKKLSVKKQKSAKKKSKKKR